MNEFNQKLTSLGNAQAPERIEATIKKLVHFYSVVGKGPEEEGALALMAEYLCQCGTDEQTAFALTQCARKGPYPVRLADFLQHIPGLEVPQADAEMRRAWDILISFVDKYVDTDVHGNYGPDHGWYGARAVRLEGQWVQRPGTYPRLSDRILDVVRRTGGWKAYKTMTERDFPFLQRRFFEEYQSWTAVEHVDSSHMIAPPPMLKELATKSTLPQENAPLSETLTLSRLAKKVPQPLTDAELRDRREMLRQQAAAILGDGRRSRTGIEEIKSV